MCRAWTGGVPDRLLPELNTLALSVSVRSREDRGGNDVDVARAQPGVFGRRRSPCIDVWARIDPGKLETEILFLTWRNRETTNPLRCYYGSCSLVIEVWEIEGENECSNRAVGSYNKVGITNRPFTPGLPCARSRYAFGAPGRSSHLVSPHYFQREYDRP